MGNSCYGISDFNFYKYEQIMLEKSGLPISDFLIRNVKVDHEGNYVRTFELGR
jgi:hypothetical protein